MQTRFPSPRTPGQHHRSSPGTGSNARVSPLQRQLPVRLAPAKSSLNDLGTLSSSLSTELIARVAEQGIIAHGNLGSSAADMLATLHSVLDSSNVFAQHAAQSMADAAQHHSGFGQALAHAPDATQLPLVDSMASHVQGLDPNAIAAAATHAAAAATMDSGIHSIAIWAAERLAVVQAIDPAAFESMRSSLGDLMDALKDVLDQQVQEQAQQSTRALVLGVHQLVTALRMPVGDAVSMGAASFGTAAGAGTLGAVPTVQAMSAAQEAMQMTVAKASGSLDGILQLILGILALVIAATPRGDAAQVAKQTAEGDSGLGPDGIPNQYSPQLLAEYFSKHPGKVMKRNAEVVSKLTGFLVSILVDWKTGAWESRMPQRAKEVRKIVEKLGPTYIKIAQAASTRVDMVPEPYLEELARLQDNVPTFSTVEARKVLEEGLGQSVDGVFEWLSEEPLAAASLGQVYRGKLRDEYGGNEVAVKVQRPNVLESASLDIFIMRRACILFSKLPGMSDQWSSVLDDWAFRFFQEMDYQLEAYNTMTFKRQMASLEGVRVATVYPELTSRKVIVTEWIEGERLGDSKTEDVRALCNTILNCYLIQLLETGLLHADPHPGNMLRTRDGKIVILDFGLMTEVTEEQRIALVEFIAHLTMEDWEGVSRDLASLGFMPDAMPEEAVAQIAPVMKMVMGQLVKGGGLRGGFNIVGMTAQLEGVARNYKLAIPPYFALVLRAFATIEGIALKTDPEYAIVRECLPYLSRRLLTDNNPRMRTALRQLLYGDSARLDIERLQRLMSAFTSFTTSSAPVATRATGPTFSTAASYRQGMSATSVAAAQQDGGAAAAAPVAAAAALSAGSRYNGALLGPGGIFDEGPVLTEPMKEALRVVFSKDGSYAQELIVDELVAATDAMSREALSEALRLVLGSASAVSALRSMEALGPLRAMLLPLPLPMEMLHSMEPAVALTKEDRQALNMIRAVIDLVGGARPGGPGGPSPLLQAPSMPDMAAGSVKFARAAGEVLPMLPELLPGMQATFELFFRQLVRRMALRLAEDLDPARAAASSSGAPSPAPATSSSSSAGPIGAGYGGYGTPLRGGAQPQPQFGMMGDPAPMRQPFNGKKL